MSAFGIKVKVSNILEAMYYTYLLAYWFLAGKPNSCFLRCALLQSHLSSSMSGADQMRTQQANTSARFRFLLKEFALVFKSCESEDVFKNKKWTQRNKQNYRHIMEAIRPQNHLGKLTGCDVWLFIKFLNLALVGNSECPQRSSSLLFKVFSSKGELIQQLCD